MAYQRQNFQDGEVLTAERLNHIEDGIVNQNEQILEQKEQINQVNENVKNIYTVNKNLLDNWYFGNPVNQRGKTEYTGEGYTVDRWKAGCKVEIANSCLKVTSTGQYSQIRQRIEFPFAGKTFTVSLMVRSSANRFIGALLYDYANNKAFAEIGNFSPVVNQWMLFSRTFTVPSDAPETLDLIIYPDHTNVGTQVIEIAAVKLELGSSQTLAHQENGKWVLNEIPNYAEELAKCQRYFHVYNTSAARPTGGMYDCVPTMRANPTQSTITTSDGKMLYANFADL